MTVRYPALWAWSWKFLKECRAERAAINTANKLRLCIYSQGLFEEINRTERLAYDRHVGGALCLYRDLTLRSRCQCRES
jgi:D-amino-acid dehydrogenase